MNEILQTPVVGTESNTATMDFDISLSEDEKRFYMKAYPNVDMVCERKVHCTVCKMHIGTAPAQEAVIRMHPVLRVTHCSKCHDFYNSGEFSKGEDGSELYCRWCGQGGEVYCCSSCPYVFCKSCILKNLTRGVVVDIEQNENWSCFNCAPKILWPLRAQHWALTKYISKQKKLIASINLSESEFKINMTKDRSSCCRLAKAKCGNMSDSMESLDSASRRSVNSNNSINNKRTQKVAIRVQSPVPKRVKPNDEVVCTPDLLSMLEPDCQITVKTRSGQSPVTSAPKVMSIENPSALQCSVSKNTPPPLVLRNTSIQMRPTIVAPITRRTVVGPRAPSPSGSAPVYHTIGGYRIDLNTAAQQETFRLPNGKLIQVKRQGSSNSQTTHTISTASIQTPVHWQRSTPTHSPVMQVTQPQSNSQQQYQQIAIPQQQQHPQLVRYQKSIVGNTTVTAIPNRSSAPIQVINSAPTASIAAVPIQATTTSAALRPQMLRHVFPDTAIGQARSQLQEQVFGAMDICAHLSGKVMTLTNSNAYKQARNYLEVKELYIHLSYLLTYAIGRFKGLQDKCLNDMRQLGFVNDADSLENGQLAADKQASDDEDNEIEIVEPKTDTINLDSDNEEEDRTTITRSIQQQVASLNRQIASSRNVVPSNETSTLRIGSPKSLLDNNVDVESEIVSGDHVYAQTSPSSLVSFTGDNMQKKQPRRKTTNKPNPTLLKQKEILHKERLDEIKRSDLKLKMKCSIELMKVEDEYPLVVNAAVLSVKDITDNAESENEAIDGEKGNNVDEKEDCDHENENTDHIDIVASRANDVKEEVKEKEEEEESRENIKHETTENKEDVERIHETTAPLENGIEASDTNTPLSDTETQIKTNIILKRPLKEETINTMSEYLENHVIISIDNDNVPNRSDCIENIPSSFSNNVADQSADTECPPKPMKEPRVIENIVKDEIDECKKEQEACTTVVPANSNEDHETTTILPKAEEQVMNTNETIENADERTEGSATELTENLKDSEADRNHDQSQIMTSVGNVIVNNAKAKATIDANGYDSIKEDDCKKGDESDTGVMEAGHCHKEGLLDGEEESTATNVEHEEATEKLPNKLCSPDI